MKRLLWIGPCLLLGACRRPDPAAVAFHAVWSVKYENGLTGASHSEFDTVDTDGRRFRLVARSDDGQSTEVYDGQTLFSQFVTFGVPPKSLVTPPRPDADDSGDESLGLSTGPVAAQPLSEAKAQAIRFWAQPPQGARRHAGLVAGRSTDHFTAQVVSSEGETTQERWLDRQTGVVLKTIDTVYSPQAKAIVTRETRECREIHYGPVEESTFEKPGSAH